jgi:hypothetical protein
MWAHKLWGAEAAMAAVPHSPGLLGKAMDHSYFAVARLQCARIFMLIVFLLR